MLALLGLLVLVLVLGLLLVPLELLPPGLEPHLLARPPRKSPECMQRPQKCRSFFIPWKNIYWHRNRWMIDAEDMRHFLLNR